MDPTNRLTGAKRYRTLRSSSVVEGREPHKNFFEKELHDEKKTGLMSIMNSMHGMQRWEATAALLRGSGHSLEAMNGALKSLRVQTYRPFTPQAADNKLASQNQKRDLSVLFNLKIDLFKKLLNC